MRILLVDDNSDNLYLLETIFTSAGFEISRAANGRQALEIMAHERPDLVVTDILMPGMDGFQLTKRIRENSETSHIPVMVYTASYTRTQDEKLALEMGASRFIIKPAEPEELLQAAREVLAAGSAAAYPARTADAEEKLLTLYNERLVHKLEDKMVELKEEIARREVVEKTLREQEETYRNMLEQMDEGYFEIDLQGTCTFANRALGRITGYREDELPGLNVSRIISPEDVPRLEKLLESISRNFEHLTAVSLVILRPDGELRYLETSLAPLFDDDNVLIGFRGVARDITALRESELGKIQLEQQFLQAQKLETIGRFAGGVAHDFNNMLSVISGYAELALMESSLPSSVARSLEEIMRAAERSSRIVSHLLSFARRQASEPKTIDIASAVEGALQMLTMLSGSQVSITWRPEEDLPPVRIDPTQLDQILTNLCVNARDAMDGEGEIIITAEKIAVQAPEAEKLELEKEGSYLQVTVCDSGSGMDEQTLEKVFEPFFTTKEPGKGTGLGLSAVYGILRQNSGGIRIASTPGEGTSISFFLPAAEKSEPRIIRPAAQSQRSGSPNHLRILVVDDEPAIRNLTAKMLETMGYETVRAAGGQEAIELCREQSLPFELLVTDFLMPQMNGLELAKELTDMGAVSRVLCMSGYASQLTREYLIDQPVVTIRKPFTLVELKEKVQSVLSG